MKLVLLNAALRTQYGALPGQAVEVEDEVGAELVSCGVAHRTERPKRKRAGKIRAETAAFEAQGETADA